MLRQRYLESTLVCTSISLCFDKEGIVDRIVELEKHMKVCREKDNDLRSLRLVKRNLCTDQTNAVPGPKATGNEQWLRSSNSLQDDAKVEDDRGG